MSKSNKLAQSLGLLTKPTQVTEIFQLPSIAVKSSQEKDLPSDILIEENELLLDSVPSIAVNNSQLQQLTAIAMQASQATFSDKMYNASFRHDSKIHDRLEVLAKQRSGGGAKFSLNSYLLFLVEKDLTEQGL